MNIIRGSVIGLAGTVGAGLLAWPVAAGAATGTDTGEAAYFKRQETDLELVATDDEDDEDTFAKRLGRETATNDRATANTRSRVSKQSRSRGNSRDATNSRKSKVSRDRDRSRGDRTRDWTRDGGDRTRDWSRNQTNDSSRNDTRRKPRR